ncbi:hypothetical protein DL96DRAFT_1627407 [Flagelloscypha sp. PMI_526]|nr:hypothetical protein DL96DRAFT_1627407 [Flagelloscypha sp. PMI_526]
MASANSTPDLPTELILSVLGQALSDIPCQSDLNLLVLSKDIYEWLLPIFYQSLDFGSNSRSPKNLKQMLTSAKSSSIRLVRMLRVGRWQHVSLGAMFLSFFNLTHLALWSEGSSPGAKEIQNLRLQHLFIWKSSDRKAIFDTLSTQSTMARTLKRFSTSEFWGRDDFQGLQVCQNLTHMLTFGHSHSLNIELSSLRTFMAKDSLICLLVAPAFGTVTRVNSAKTAAVFEPLCDPRIVVARTMTERLRDTGTTPDFWSDLSTVWKTAETAIKCNASSKVRIWFVRDMKKSNSLRVYRLPP